MNNELFKKKTAQVAFRIRCNRLFHLFYKTFIVSSILYIVILLVSRLLNVSPWKPDLFSAFIPLMLSLAVALLFSRRVTQREAVHAMDVSSGTKDLFLTNLMLEKSAGRYQNLVNSRAEAEAENVKPPKTAPLQWEHSVYSIITIIPLIVLGIYLLPQLDPFGKDEMRKKQEEWEERLELSKKATNKILAAIRKTDTAKRNTTQVESALKALKSTLKKVKKSDKIGNVKKLGKQQKDLGELWRKSNSKQLQGGGKSNEQKQRFGTLDPGKASEWKKKLAKGDPARMKSEIEKMRRTLSRLKKEKDPAEKEKLKRELRRQMKDMEEFFTNSMNSPGVRSALKQALDQLSMSDMKGLSEKALEALKDSLDLTDAQLEQFAQDLRDMEDLEQALLTLQKARKLNQSGLLDGKAEGKTVGQGGMSLKDYEDLYNKMLSGAGKGSGTGEGMKGPGTGEGGKAPEDDSEKSEFTPEQSKSALTAGKILLKMKTKGLGEKGEIKRDYQEMVQEVKQGVSEAIIQEEIPPDYHDSIKEYFDTMKGEQEDDGEE